MVSTEHPVTGHSAAIVWRRAFKGDQALCYSGLGWPRSQVAHIRRWLLRPSFTAGANTTCIRRRRTRHRYFGIFPLSITMSVRTQPWWRTSSGFEEPVVRLLGNAPTVPPSSVPLLCGTPAVRSQSCRCPVCTLFCRTLPHRATGFLGAVPLSIGAITYLWDPLCPCARMPPHLCTLDFYGQSGSQGRVYRTNQ